MKRTDVHESLLIKIHFDEFFQNGFFVFSYEVNIFMREVVGK